MNFYGFWQYAKEKPLKNGTEIVKGDLVRVISKNGDTLISMFKGSIKELDVKYFLDGKKKFVRPPRSHKPSTCKRSLNGEKCINCEMYLKKRETN